MPGRPLPDLPGAAFDRADQLKPVFNLELLEDIVDVVLDHVIGDEKLPSILSLVPRYSAKAG